jgi:hypothetical protein
MVTLRAYNPWTNVMALPVNNSAPANTISVSATPNTTPWTRRVMGDPAAASGGDTLTSNATATPTKAPAYADSSR